MQTRTRTRPITTAIAGGIGAIALALSGAAAAHAHVTVGSSTDQPGAYAVLTVSVPHGCDDSATTAVAIRIPEGINSVTPTRNAFYTVDVTTQTLDTPATDSHGNEVTERVDQVVYTAVTPLPADQRDAFELSVQLPDVAAGTVLYFPTVQTCEQGEVAWVQIPADGQDPHELDAPAPAIVIAAAAGAEEPAADAGDEPADAADETDPATDAPPAAAADDAPSPLSLIAVIVGTLGLIAGAIAIAMARRRTRA